MGAWAVASGGSVGDGHRLRSGVGHPGGRGSGVRVMDELGCLHDVWMGGQRDDQHDHRHDGQDGGEDEGEGVAAEDGRTEGADGRAEDEAADLEGAVVAEGFTPLVRLRGVHDHAAGRRVVHADGRPGHEAQDELRRERREEDGQQADHGEDDQAHDHLGLARVAVRPPAEEGLGDELGDGPGGHDETELGGIDALLLHEEGQDGQQRAEADHDDELRAEYGQQRTPTSRPGPDAAGDVEADVGHRRQRSAAAPAP